MGTIDMIIVANAMFLFGLPAEKTQPTPQTSSDKIISYDGSYRFFSSSLCPSL